MPEQESNKPDKHKLRWYQYHLSTLMFIVIPVCAIACTFYRMKADQAERQRQAVEELWKLELEVLYDYQVDEKGEWIPQKKQQLPGPRWLREWQGIDFLADVVIVRGVGMFGLSHMTDEGMKFLSGMTKLKWLGLPTTETVSDEGMQNLVGMTKLKWLRLDVTHVGDEGLKLLTGMTKLEVLILNYTQVTDEGMKHLAEMTNLEYLFLSNTQVGDDGLEHMMGLRNLEYLDIYNTQVTAEGVAKLRKALPNCEIIWDDK